MSRHCPHLDLSCEECIEEFLDEYPVAAYVRKHTFHLCDCLYIAIDDTEDSDAEHCVGCGGRRDTHREFMAFYPRAVAS
jgi:hypothetical protein